jgi:hypothetical protein
MKLTKGAYFFDAAQADKRGQCPERRGIFSQVVDRKGAITIPLMKRGHNPLSGCCPDQDIRTCEPGHCNPGGMNGT